VLSCSLRLAKELIHLGKGNFSFSSICVFKFDLVYLLKGNEATNRELVQLRLSAYKKPCCFTTIAAIGYNRISITKLTTTSLPPRQRHLQWQSLIKLHIPFYLQHLLGNHHDIVYQSENATFFRDHPEYRHYQA